MSQWFTVSDAIKSLAKQPEFRDFMAQVAFRRNEWRERNDTRGSENPETGVQVLADIEKLALEAGYKAKEGARNEDQ